MKRWRWTAWLRADGCKHPIVRCIHGDEIIHRGYRRVLCIRCGRALKGPMPEVCWFTGEPHPSVQRIDGKGEAV